MNIIESNSLPTVNVYLEQDFWPNTANVETKPIKIFVIKSKFSTEPYSKLILHDKLS